jgi:hypothetical protein
MSVYALRMKALASGPFLVGPRRGTSLLVDAVHENGQEEAVIDVVGIEQRRPGRYAQLHGGIEAAALGPCVDVAVRLTAVDGLEPAGCRREDVADVVVAHRDSRDGRELRGAAVVECVSVDGEQRTDPFAWVERDRACHDCGDIAVQHGEVGGRRLSISPASEPLVEVNERHGRLRHGC